MPVTYTDGDQLSCGAKADRDYTSAPRDPMAPRSSITSPFQPAAVEKVSRFGLPPDPVVPVHRKPRIVGAADPRKPRHDLSIKPDLRIFVREAASLQVGRYCVKQRAVCSKLEVTKMDAQMLSANREPGIWARLMQNPGGELLPEAAEYLLSIRFAESDVDRMRQLAERSESGELTDEERAEFDSYLHVGNLLAVIQSKARLALRRR